MRCDLLDEIQKLSDAKTLPPVVDRPRKKGPRKKLSFDMQTELEFGDQDAPPKSGDKPSEAA